ncbi:MAG: GGDEF domain-containing protein [Burkholderiales bacterium]|nr:GGDEF domain-containing protein [Burkholderiales bacterium]
MRAVFTLLPRLLPAMRGIGARAFALALLLALAGGAVPASGAGPASEVERLTLDGRADIALWPAVTLLADPDNRFDAATLAGQPQRFARPEGVPGNLGRRDETIWLRARLVVPGPEAARRVLEIDYPPLNRIDLYLLQDGQVVTHHVLGNHLRGSERPLASRTHAAPLTLAAGEHEVLLRVQTLSSMVVPITLRTQASFTAYEARVQLVQGLLFGVALCMLMYSVLHWLNLRDNVFGYYALLLVGNMVFMLAYFGIGPQWLWPQWPEISMQVAPLGVLLAVAAGAPFMHATLAVPEVSPLASRLMRTMGALAVLGLVANLGGLIGYRATQTMVTVLGLAAAFAVVPVAYVRARRGERVALVILGGWLVYFLGAVGAAGLLRGYIEPTFWTQHVYPFTTMIEMTAWMAVLGLRVHSIHRDADRMQLEADAQRRLAETDALTGLLNRRGLQRPLEAALRGSGPQRMTALYLLDLDGFKPVNDRYGHDVGDALLVAVGERLRAQLRGSDLVARLGGDEFVVLAAGLEDDGAALALGRKLLAAFDKPFDAAGQRCEVGLTVGYAIAPLDGDSGSDLLKRADAAMYAGKQAGKRRVIRGGRSLVTA